MSKTYINQSTLSAKLGWSEATGRKWITEFQEFIPPKIVGKSSKINIVNNIVVSIKKKIVVKEIDFSYFEGE